MSESGTRRSVGRPQTGQAEDPGLRKTILQSCLDAIAIYGLPKFSLKDVSRLAGVSPASIYYHFGNKETLHRKTLEHYFLPIFEHADSVVRNYDNAMEILARLFLNIQEPTQRDPKVLKLYVDEAFQKHNLLRETMRHHYPATGLAIILAKIRKAQEEGVLKAGLEPEFICLWALSGGLFCTGCHSQWEDYWDHPLDRSKARDNYLFMFCISIEGPRCDYDWRANLFPDGLPTKD
ncbi:MAG: TetR/AcrR family transcriptional regulator [Deltaproteobacteria bacterium]|jgi:AcrR family transcriptional regulator|nr:TetR/AcrR family transcriptional regulator [Deltaproteobacteria bacterium]